MDIFGAVAEEEDELLDEALAPNIWLEFSF